MYDCERERNTGRSTRLLEHAISEAQEGRRIYVVSSSTANAEFLWERCKSMLDDAGEFSIRPMVIDFPRGMIEFSTVGRIDWDWDLLTFRGVHPSNVLVDHEVIERRYRRELEALHRFDMMPALH